MKKCYTRIEFHDQFLEESARGIGCKITDMEEIRKLVTEHLFDKYREDGACYLHDMLESILARLLSETDAIRHLKEEEFD